MSSTVFGIQPARVTVDTIALWRHFWIRLRAVATDPVSLPLLLFVGLLTLPLWRSLAWVWGPVGLHDRLRSPGLGFALFFEFLLAPLIALAASGSAFAARSRTGSGRTLPALPVGPRARVIGEVGVGLAIVLAPRMLGFLATRAPHALGPLGRICWGLHLQVPEDTALGALLLLPLLVAWTTASRLDWRGLLIPAGMMTLVYAAGTSGMMERLPLAALTSLALSFFVLAFVNVDLEGSLTVLPNRHFGPLFRPSPGPLVQFRRDQWLGPLRTLGPFLLLVLPLPLLSRAYYGTAIPGALLQLMLLLLLFLYPLGLSLPGSRSLFGGYFTRAWSTLPVRTEWVVRAVFAYGLIVGVALDLLLGAYASGLRAAYTVLPVVLFEAPVVLLAAGIMVCEAVGDRKRGLLAVASLVALQVGWPVTLALLDAVLASSFHSSRQHFLAGAYALGLIGGLPPLVHLRRARAPRATQEAQLGSSESDGVRNDRGAKS